MRDDNADQKKSGKSKEAFRTISEVASELELPQHVLRFWETKFNQIKPMKRGGNRRYYRPDDVDILRTIKQLLHQDGYTIRGVQKLMREQGVKQTVDAILSGEPAAHAAIERPDVAASIEKAQPTAERAENKRADTDTQPVISEGLQADIEAVLKELRRLKDQLSQSL